MELKGKKANVNDVLAVYASISGVHTHAQMILSDGVSHKRLGG